MPSKSNAEEYDETFLCDCHSIGHLLNFWYMVPNAKDPADEMYVIMLFSSWRGFWKRLAASISFALGGEGFEAGGGVFQPVTFRSNDYERLENILAKQVKDEQPREQKNLISVTAGDYSLRFAYEVCTHTAPNGEKFEDHEVVARIFFRDKLSALQRLRLAWVNIWRFGRHFGGEEHFTLTPEDSRILKDMVWRCRTASSTS